MSGRYSGRTSARSPSSNPGSEPAQGIRKAGSGRRPQQGEEPGGEQEGRQRLGHQQRLVLEQGRVDAASSAAPIRPATGPASRLPSRKPNGTASEPRHGQHDQGERRVDPAAA